MGRPSLSFQSYISPLDASALCEIAIASIPPARTFSRKVQRSSGRLDWAAVKGWGAWSALKKTLR